MSEYRVYNYNFVVMFGPWTAAAAKFRRDSLFCPDELDSLFSYFDTGSGPRSKSTSQSVHAGCNALTRLVPIFRTIQRRVQRQTNSQAQNICIAISEAHSVDSVDCSSDGGVREKNSMCCVMINVSVAWQCLAPQVLAATAAWEEVPTAARTSWYLARWWTVSRKKVRACFIIGYLLKISPASPKNLV